MENNVITRFEELNLMDKFLFDEVVEDREAYQALISIVLENEIECPDLKLGDGAVRVFINTKGTNKDDFSQEFLNFMRYVTETTDTIAENTESSRIKLIHKQVKGIKLICKKLVKNESPEEIAEDLEEETGTILPICELDEEFAPEYDSEKVYEKYCITFSDSFETGVTEKAEQKYPVMYNQKIIKK